MVKLCEKCGLPPDLCICNPTTGQPLSLTPERLMPPIRPRRCLKCGKTGLYSREILEQMCMCCGVISKFHIGCGGRVEDYDIFERKY